MRDERNFESADESQTDLERSPGSSTVGEAAPPLERGSVLAGRYEIRQVIGRGGMGLVVEALDRILGEAIAIKILRAEYAGERSWAERLAREVKLARQIHHPNVCRVFDFAQADGRVFLTMELTSRGSLRDEISAGVTARRPLDDRIADVRALAAGLGAIHAAGILHRDVSPQNVLRMPDGRAVLSDFGLATDSFESTTNVGGGTIAYMAPELIQSGRASVASDVWALGVVSHEIVFGERPHWRPGAHEMSSPVLRRRLAPGERAVLEICRACTAADPERRPRRVAEIAAQLTDVGMRRSAWRRWAGRLAAVACVGAAMVGVVGGVRRMRAKRAAVGGAAAVESDPLLIVPTGVPDDWTDKSKVLAEVPEKIRCTSLLPDHRTVRFVWGRPSHAKDVETHTGQRKPSPLVPAAYAEGCPDVSPDGRRMVYTGHTPDGRAFAFVSSHADGSAGVPVVPIAEPSVNSDPTWLPDGESFSYEIDLKNMGVFSVETSRSTVLPRPTLSSSSLDRRHVVGNRIFVSAMITVDGDKTELVGFGWPSLTEEVRFRLSGQILDLESRDGTTFYYWRTSSEGDNSMLEYDLLGKRAFKIGFVPRQAIRYPRFVTDGLSFATTKSLSDLELRDSTGVWVQITRDADLLVPALCGQDIVASTHSNGSLVVVRLDRGGRLIRQMTTGPFDWEPVCTSDGRAFFYLDYARRGAIVRCDDTGCRTIMKEGAGSLSISPDDQRLAYVALSNRGAIVRWMSSSGGEAHDIEESANSCDPGWSSEGTLWVFRRKGKGWVWIEMDADSGRPTGKAVAEARDCSDGSDPSSPITRQVRTVVDHRSQIRILPDRYLPTRQ